jgi:cell division protein FtsZ
MFEIEDSYQPSACIKVVGVGGAGGNAINRMIQAGVQGVEFIALNTDLQVLNSCQAPVKIQIGAKLTQGKGTGANPEVGRQAALESQDEISDALKGADMVFIAAGMGKGTGTGAAPVVAELALSKNILTLPVVTRPFSALEGPTVQNRAESGLEALAKVVDSMLVIPNDRLLQMAGKVPIMTAYALADETLRHAVQSIADIITREGFINVDFNDVSTVMRRKGGTYMGVGAASGEGAAQRSAAQALANPFLENVNIDGATGALINITSRSEESFTTEDLQTVLKVVKGAMDPQVDLIYGIGLNDGQTEDVKVTVIATGFNRRAEGRVLPGLAELAKVMHPRPGAASAPAQRLGEVSDFDRENLDIPAFMRRRGSELLEKPVR